MLANGVRPSFSDAKMRTVINAYLASTLGNDYYAGNSSQRELCWCFAVKWQRDGINPVMVGTISFDTVTDQLIELTPEQIQDMQEAGPVQIAQYRGELARSTNGYVLRYHARIKANMWVSNHVDLKVGAEGGIWVPLDEPIWRYSIYYRTAESNLSPIGAIDVDAQSGCVIPLHLQELQTLQVCVRAAKQHQALATAA